jgi:hypothetical protein
LDENRALQRRRRPDQPDREREERRPADVAPVPAAAALLALQRTAGNHATGRMLARSPLAPPGPVGEVTAGIPLFDYETKSEAKAVREIALGPAAGFAGFETEQEAVVAASGSERIGVVVADGEGRFHAYETDLEPVWGPLFQRVSKYEIRGGRVVRWTHLDTPGDAASYADQIRLAYHLARFPDKHEEARRLFMNLLQSAVGLDASEVHDSTDGEALPGKVSFNLGYEDANAHAGIVGKLPSDRETPLPEPTLEVGPLSFTTLTALRATVLHELAHVNHAVRAIEAVKQWRATTTDGKFLTWLAREQKKRRIDAVDFAVIKEEVEGGTENTESLAYLVSFTAAYHLEDVAGLPADDEVIDEKLLFGKLGQLADEWPRADHAVQEHVLEQLIAYRDSLDTTHRERFARYVNRKHDRCGDTSVYRLFWGPLR